MITVRDFVKVAQFESNYAHLAIYDPTGMIECGYFNGFYKLTEDDPLLDYEIISISDNFNVKINISEDEARKQRELH